MKKLIAAVTVLTVSSAQAGVVIHVDAVNCPGPGDGSIGDPYCSIQMAIDNAVNTDEIVVAPGTYFEAVNFLGKTIIVRSTDPTDPTVVADTVIDGTGNFHVVQCVGGEGADTRLEGFTVTGGDATGVPYPDSAGGGMYNDESSPTVINCAFSGNSASQGGGMFSHHGGPVVTNCTFSRNSADNTGGGMYNFHSSPTVTGSTFTGNSAVVGGGMYSDGEVPAVTSCTFSGNSAIVGGGMSNDLSSPVVTNCTFVGNSADNGGGMINYGGSFPTVINCTFSGNTASTGGGMYNVDGNPTVTNCILWNDSPDEIDGFAATMTFNDIQGGQPGIGNIDVDPMFADPGNGDLRLLSGSPCIDAGDNTAVPMGVLRDLAGNPRFVDDPGTPDTGNGEPPIVDMGAYEFASCPWDCEPAPNGEVGITDFLATLAQWGGPGSCDFDGSGVGITDLLDLLANWGPCP